MTELTLRNISMLSLCVPAWLSILFLAGVIGVDAVEVKSVSVMEGDSVTLHTNLTHIEIQDQILWMFGPRNTRIADIHRQKANTYGAAGMKLDSQTGSLTITNIRFKNSGLYKLEIINSKETAVRKFNVTVYEHLPVPITNQPQQLNTTIVCQTCSDVTARNRSHVCAIIVAVVVVLVVLIMSVIAVKHCWTTRQSDRDRANRDEVSVPLAAANGVQHPPCLG